MIFRDPKYMLDLQNDMCVLYGTGSARGRIKKKFSFEKVSSRQKWIFLVDQIIEKQPANICDHFEEITFEIFFFSKMTALTSR